MRKMLHPVGGRRGGSYGVEFTCALVASGYLAGASFFSMISMIFWSTLSMLRPSSPRF